jgi:hypothetical protein
MTKRQLLIGIPVIVLLANGIGYLLVNGRRSSAPPSASSVPGAPPAEGVARGTGAAAGPPSAEMQAAEEKRREETALGRRAAGLAALEAGDYDKALIQFTEARALLGDKAHVAELLRVTQDLRSRPPSAPRARGAAAIPVSPPAPSAPYRAAARGLGARRAVAVKDDPSPGPAGSPGEGPPPASPSGLLIVTTTPRGLLVQVDDNPVDLTPMRTRVKPGTHRIALLDGDRKVYETTVDVRDGATATLLKDLAGPEPAAEAPRTLVPSSSSPSSTTASTALAGQRAEAPRVAVPPPVEVAISRPAGLVASPPPSPPSLRNLAPPESGGLVISSPGLYGVVWINGRARGYPPLEVRNVPAGQVKVEVRVNGVEKRASTVVVRPGSTTNVKLTAAESVQ